MLCFALQLVNRALEFRTCHILYIDPSGKYKHTCALYIAQYLYKIVKILAFIKKELNQVIRYKWLMNFV
jgi:hypothetical protein